MECCGSQHPGASLDRENNATAGVGNEVSGHICNRITCIAQG